MISKVVFLRTTSAPTPRLMTELNVINRPSLLVSNRVREVTKKGHYEMGVKKVT
jgi:hypothetical protein